MTGPRGRQQTALATPLVDSWPSNFRRPELVPDPVAPTHPVHARTTIAKRAGGRPPDARSKIRQTTPPTAPPDLFALLPYEVLFDRRLIAEDRDVYAWLCWSLWRTQFAGEVALGDIARDLGRSKSKIRVSIRRLEGAGQVITTPGAPGLANSYALPWQRLHAFAHRAASGRL